MAKTARTTWKIRKFIVMAEFKPGQKTSGLISIFSVIDVSGRKPVRIQLI